MNYNILSIVELMKLLNSKKVAAATNKAANVNNTFKVRRRALNQLPKVDWDSNSSLNIADGNYMPSCIINYMANVPEGMSNDEFYNEYIKPCIDDDRIIYAYDHPVDDTIFIGIEEDIIEENWYLKIPLGRYLSSNIWVDATRYGSPTIIPSIDKWYYLNLIKLNKILKFTYDRRNKKTNRRR